MGSVALPLATAARAGGIPPRGHGGPWRDTPTTPTPSSSAAMEMAETADITEEWLEPGEEEAVAPLRDRNERDSHPPTAVRRAPPADTWSTDADGLTSTPTMTWTSATATQPLDRLDPLEDPLAESHLVDHLEEDSLEEDDSLVEDPLEEDPWWRPVRRTPWAPRWSTGSGCS